MWFVLFPTFGMLWFALTISFLVGLFILEECNEPGKAMGCLLFYASVVTIFGEGVHFFNWTAAHPFYFLTLVVGYVIFGAAWGVTRYWWDQTQDRIRYEGIKRNFLIMKKIIGENGTSRAIGIPDTLRKEWLSYLERHGSGYGSMPIRRYFDNQKTAIINRMMWWPFSVFMFLFKDILFHAYELFLHHSRAIFMRIERRVWGGVEDDFKPVNPFPSVEDEHNV